MKVALIIVGELSDNSKRGHLNHLNNQLYHRFTSSFNNIDVFAYESDGLYKSKNYFDSSKAKLKSLILKITKRKRTYNELLLDFENWLKKEVNKEQYTHIFCSRAVSIKPNYACKIAGISTINPMPVIKDLLDKEAKKYSFAENSFYTLDDRIKKQTEIFKNWDLTIPGTPSQYAKSNFEFYASKTLITKAVYSSPNNFEPKKYTLCSESINFLTTSQPDSLKKGVSNILEAWRIFKSEFPQLKSKLTVLGSVEPDLRNVYDKICTKDVEYPGRAEKIEDYYFKSHFFISGSIIDLGPRTIRQCMQIGLPVISSSSCGMSEHLNSKSSFIFEYGSPKELAHILKQACETDWEKMSQEVKLLASKLSTEKYIDEIIANFKAL
jgi:glycosyltransferase involved in cell wall biosynthesis